MALNLKNRAVERLAAEVSRLTGESKTEAIRRSLEERKRRLAGASPRERRARVMKLLRGTIWASVPEHELGRRLSRAEEDAIFGLGPDGV
ncbi:MAG TPA: type II toxin-antitoxin system VapB family antitoxin [Vicinamibacterales bacterium]|nr:type II toxin-antitoxin system VapB family antitoxin [Vicinamibacterales bacterium]